MADLTPYDHVALELCQSYVDCASCRHRVDVVTRLIDEHLTAAHARVHELMRGWAGEATLTSFSPQQHAARMSLGHVLEELRKVVGHEGTS